MKIYIAPCNSKYSSREKHLREIIELANESVHSLIEEPGNADIILIVDTVFAYEYQWKFLDKYLNKCYAIGTNTTSHLMIPGLYNNAPIGVLQKYRFRGCCYISRTGKKGNPFLEFNNNVEKEYLFSFVGGSTSWPRKRLLKMKFNRNDILIRCTDGYSDWKPHPNRELMQESYANILKSSKFVLCPRGSGWGIIRVFEAMKVGVVPVIISDKWLAPMGPDWASFALFVKQSDLKNIVEILESHASEYEERGHLARKAWEEYFSAPTVFNQCMEAIKDLKANRIAILDRLIFYSYPLILSIDKLKTNFQKLIKSIILKLFNIFKLQFPYELVNK